VALWLNPGPAQWGMPSTMNTPGQPGMDTGMAPQPNSPYPSQPPQPVNLASHLLKQRKSRLFGPLDSFDNLPGR